jgi:hypothetical protein
MSYNVGKFEWSEVVQRVFPIEKKGMYIVHFFCVLEIDGTKMFVRLKQNKERIRDDLFIDAMRRNMGFRHLDIKLISLKNLPKLNVKTSMYHISKTSNYIEYFVYDADVDVNNNFIPDKTFQEIPEEESTDVDLINRELIDQLVFNFTFFVSNEFKYMHCRNFNISLTQQHILPYYAQIALNSSSTKPNDQLSEIFATNVEHFKRSVKRVVQNFDTNAFEDLLREHKLSFGAKKIYRDKVYRRLELLEESSSQSLVNYVK